MTPGAPIQVPGEAPGVSVPYPSDAGAMSKVPLGDGPLSAFASNAMGPSPASAAPSEGQGGPFDAMLKQAAGGGFDPVEAAARLVQLGAPREVIAQVLAQSGMLQQGRRVA